MHVEVVQRRGLRKARGRVCLVLPMFENGPAPESPLLDPVARRALHALSEQDVLTGKAREVYYLPTPDGRYDGVLIAGLGKRRGVDVETLRRAAGNACPVLRQQRVEHVIVDVSKQRRFPVEAFIEGMILGGYEFDAYKKPDEKDGPKSRVRAVTVVVGARGDVPRVRARCEYAAVVALSANAARNLANTPANDMTPTALAAFAIGVAKEPHCACEVLDEDAMRRLGMRALLGVARGSDEPPRLIVIRYAPPGATRTVAIVGKGVTFDTGGVSLKPPEAMHEMKYDMCGAAATLCTMLAIAQLRPRINVVCVVPAVENKVGPAAQTPGDIVTASNGVTIEVHNTDAEGRLILADALAYTIKRFRPKAVVDVATLTGACVIALGHYAAGVLSNSDALHATLEAAADAAGERIWRLPLWDDYRELTKGTHADLCNIGPPKEAGTIVGGAFLERFVGKTPWAHLDIAGTAWGVKNIPYLDPKHATGYGVRLLTRWVMDCQG